MAKIQARLKDIPNETTYDLTSLLKEHREVTIGRKGNRNLIELGEGLSPERSEEFNLNAVSRHHATMGWENGLLYIKDENSKNGTFVNGKRISNVNYVLRVNSHIRLGDYPIFLKIEMEE